MTDRAKRLSGRLSTLWIIIGAIIALGVYAVLAWAIPRGFDSSDEAWQYALVASNRVAVGEAWGFQHVLHPLFDMTGQSVIAFRIFRLLGYFLVSAFLLMVIFKSSRALGITLRLSQWIFVLIASQVGTFLAWSFPPRTLGYNELSSWLSQVGASLIVLLVVSRVADRPVIHRRWLLMLWCGLGAIVLLLLAVKVTTGVVFAILAVVALSVGSVQLSFLRRLAAGLAGLVGAFLVLLLSGFPFLAYANNLLFLAFDRSARSAYGHPLDGVITTYAASFDDAFKVLLSSILLFIVLISMLLILLVPGLDSAIARVLRLAAMIVAILLFVSLFWWPYLQITFTYLGYFSLFVGIAALVIFGLLLAMRARNEESGTRASRRTRWPISFAILVVVATPFSGAVGTNNAITGQLLYSVTIWMVVLAFCLVVLSDRLIDRGRHILASAPSVLLVLLLLLSAAAVRGDILNHPYRIAPYAEQQRPTTARYLSGLLLIKPQATLVNWMTAQGNELHAKGVPTIALASPEGLLTFNADGFVSPWVDPFWGVSFKSIEAACLDGKPSELFVLQPGSAKITSGVVKQTNKALQSCAMSFPADFTIVGRHDSTDPEFTMTIWKLTPAS